MSAAAQRAAENGARLTEQLLAFSRRQHLQPRAVDLNAVVAGHARDADPHDRHHDRGAHSISAPDLWPALVDPTQIETAILNLAINARDAMPLGGTLTIETRNLPARRRPVIPAELAGRDCVRSRVRDTGTGMPDEVLRSAVEPFFTTKEPGKGSGLGLSQVYGTCGSRTARCEIESRVGAGTEVHLFLPRALRRAGRARAGARAGRRPSRTADAFWSPTTIPACARSPRRCCGNAGSR